MGSRAALGVVFAALACALPGPALAAAPCWKSVLNDRYDGQLDRTYPPRCYSEALDHVPADVEAYTATSADIRRALLDALAARRPSTPAVAPPVRRTVASSTQRTETGGVAGAQATIAGPVAASAPPKPLDGAGLASREPLVVVGIPALLVVTAVAAKLLAHRRLRAQVDDADAVLGR